MCKPTLSKAALRAQLEAALAIIVGRWDNARRHSRQSPCSTELEPLNDDEEADEDVVTGR
jgi:hypothetical protein